MKSESVQNGRSMILFINNTVMPDSDPASPAFIKERRSRIRCGMTSVLNNLRFFSNSHISPT